MGILDPLFFFRAKFGKIEKIWKNRKNLEKYFFPKNLGKIRKNSEKYFQKFGKILVGPKKKKKRSSLKFGEKIRKNTENSEKYRKIRKNSEKIRTNRKKSKK